MRGIIEEVVGFFGFDYFAFIHVHDVICRLARKTHLVSDAKHGHARFSELNHHVQDFLDHLRIKRTCGFIKEHDFRIHTQTARNRNALLLPTRKLAGVLVGLIRNFHPLKEFQRGFARFFLRGLAHPNRRKRAVFKHCHVREKIKRLKNHAYFAPNIIDSLEVVRKLNAFDDQLPLLVNFKSIDTTQQGRFARTRRPANNQSLAARNGQVNILQGMKFAVPFIEVANINHQFAIGGIRSFSGVVHMSIRARKMIT